MAPAPVIEVEGSGPTLFTLFGLNVTWEVTTEWGIMLVMIILAILATRRLTMIPHGLQNGLEMAVDMVVDGIVAPAIGGRDKAMRYMPYLGTLFLFIIISNYSGLFPGAGHLPGFKAPTGTLSVTVALAVTAFIATHTAGFREQGFHYFKHFLEPMPFMLPLNLVEEVIRPLSLSLRLFGNIFGEEAMLLVILSLIPYFVPIPLMVLDLLFGFLQAFIFTVLTATYIGGAISEEA